MNFSSNVEVTRKQAKNNPLLFMGGLVYHSIPWSLGICGVYMTVVSPEYRQIQLVVLGWCALIFTGIGLVALWAARL